MDIKFLIKNKSDIIILNNKITDYMNDCTKDKNTVLKNLLIILLPLMGVFFLILSFFLSSFLINLTPLIEESRKLAIILSWILGFSIWALPFLSLTYFKKKKEKAFLKNKPLYQKTLFNYIKSSLYKYSFPWDTLLEEASRLNEQFIEKELQILQRHDFEEYIFLNQPENKEKLKENIFQYIKDNKIDKSEEEKIFELFKSFNIEITDDRLDLLLYKNYNENKPEKLINVNNNLAIKNI